MFVAGLLMLLFWWVVAPVFAIARYGALRVARKPARWSWLWPVGPAAYALLFWLGSGGP